MCNKPIIILVRPQMHENIGAVARAMANFSLSELRIVSPRDGVPSQRAYNMSSGADYILDNAIIYDDLLSSISDVNFLYATTARNRDVNKPVSTPVEAVLNVINNTNHKTAFLFGAERTGLENTELLYANAIINIPVNPDFSSLNLAQSVLIIAYEWFKNHKSDIIFNNSCDDLASIGEINYFYEHLEDALDKKGFFYPPPKKASMIQNIRSLFSRVAMTKREVGMMRGIIKSLFGE